MFLREKTPSEWAADFPMGISGHCGECHRSGLILSAHSYVRLDDVLTSRLLTADSLDFSVLVCQTSPYMSGRLLSTCCQSCTYMSTNESVLVAQRVSTCRPTGTYPLPIVYVHVDPTSQYLLTIFLSISLPPLDTNRRPPRKAISACLPPVYEQHGLSSC